LPSFLPSGVLRRSEPSVPIGVDAQLHGAGTSQGRRPVMAEMVTIDGQQSLKRNPLGVLGLSFVTLGIYFLVWYYKVNDELRRAERDETISPTRSLMAMLFGWLII